MSTIILYRFAAHGLCSRDGGNARKTRSVSPSLYAAQKLSTNYSFDIDFHFITICECRSIVDIVVLIAASAISDWRI
jgi:hypothetical protein